MSDDTGTYEEIIGNAILADTADKPAEIERAISRAAVKMAVSRDIFCRGCESILDQDRATFFESKTSDNCAILCHPCAASKIQFLGGLTKVREVATVHLPPIVEYLDRPVRKPQFKTRKINLNSTFRVTFAKKQDGQSEPIPCHLYGPWAVHRKIARWDDKYAVDSSRGWAISHVPTGGYAAKRDIRTYPEACHLAESLAAENLGEWSNPTGPEAKAESRRIRAILFPERT